MTKQELVEAHWTAICKGGQIELLDANDADDPPSWSIHDDDVLDVSGGEYLILTDDEADERATESIKDQLWAFNTSFLSGETGVDEAVFTAIAANGKCESNNDVIASLLKSTCGVDQFIEAAIGADSRGHFLAGYDSEEIEIEVGGTKLYAYRTN